MKSSAFQIDRLHRLTESLNWLIQITPATKNCGLLYSDYSKSKTMDIQLLVESSTLPPTVGDGDINCLRQSRDYIPKHIQRRRRVAKLAQRRGPQTAPLLRGMGWRA